MAEDKTKATGEQIAYANILNIGMYIGLAIITVTFIVYVFGILPSFISPQEIPKYWTMKSGDFIHDLGAPTGWGWAALIGKGDYTNFIGIAILGGLTILCYIVILPILMQKKDIPYVVIAIIEIAVLVLAASGILKAGGH
ncbi:MAG: hypothetical protein AB1348_01765 [Nitrospirota bacterium]